MDQETKREFEKLGDSIKRGFDSVDERFEKVEGEIKDLRTDVKDLRSTMQTQYVSKSYLDQKLGEHTEAILMRIDRKFEREKKFKAGILDILKRNKLASSEEIQTLEQLI